MAPIIYSSIYPEYLVPTNKSLGQYLLDVNPDDISPDKVIYEDIDPKGSKITYGGLRRDAAKLAAELVHAFNLKMGDAVVVYAANSANYILLAHAVMWFGGTIIGINVATSEHDLGHYLSVAAAKLIVVEPHRRGVVERTVAHHHTTVPSAPIINIDNQSAVAFPHKYLRSTAVNPIPPVDLSNIDNRTLPAAVVFSSGTSGKPKGVHLSHYGMIANALSNRTANPEDANADSREVFFGPFPHLFGLLGGVLIPAFLGNYIAILPAFVYDQYIQSCSKVGSTVMRMVPAVAVAITKDPRIDQLDLTTVKTLMCAGAALQVEVVQRLQQIMPRVSITQGYGMSEVSVAGLRGRRSAEKAGSVGRLYPGVKMRIIDDNMNDVKLGEPGEALIKAPTVFAGYRNNPKSTQESFHDGWLRTGDTLSIDKDGFLWFKDRKKEMIKYKGMQVAPAELEDLLASHPEVEEAAVCALWHEDGQTEVPIGYVVLSSSVAQNDREAALKRIRESVDKIVSPYKKLRGGVFAIDAIPKNPTGKIQRSELPARKEKAGRGAAAAKTKL
ncbi:acyl-CoA synthetases/AMP-acid ligases II [Eremomyces bilateralis CBS 781.70]|uniref:Acyl-CoA synthetases/AMP-acid ligases II n=1 Tax=Eremomyces bilateralis CBS 781.70 TaxID=1392243 RepID=A0A6G1G4C3_9PEZI|nr:acyl-CoA synthetases/AMP-acid ligases II [Eremomyces bilateralis CBS 781.70]KAF1812760.1 acyl-CoA synthetases/AMP-acid ligases II [Eremomyces bilateralis CBS 781.70]